MDEKWLIASEYWSKIIIVNESKMIAWYSTIRKLMSFKYLVDYFFQSLETKKSKIFRRCYEQAL